MTDHKESLEVQRLAVVNTGRRRRWTLEEKLRIVAESFQGVGHVSATARRHDISPSLLYSWRKAFRDGTRCDGELVGFAPAMIVPDELPEADQGTAAGRMEVVTRRGHRIIVGADVDAGALARVVAALEAPVSER